jgi:hypothetical protein
MMQTPLIFYGKGQRAICHSSEDRLLHLMDVKTESPLLVTISYIANVRISAPFNIKLIV